METKENNLFKLDLFKELRETYFEISNNIKPTVTEFNFIGSRGSRKTYLSLDLLIKVFFAPQNNITYIFREKEGQILELQQELFPKLEELGFKVSQGQGGTYNAKKMTLTNGYNKIIFKTINAEKMDLSKGAGAGLPVWLKADNIFAFFEECTQMNEIAINMVSQGLRGHKDTNIIRIYCANPWSPLNWYVMKCNNILKENISELCEFGHQKKVYYDEEKKRNVLVMRNNILVNKYLADDLRSELESFKEIDNNFWLIVARGASGVLGDLIYANNLNKMREYDPKTLLVKGSYFQGGLDWGDGSSRGASPTTMHFGSINLISGVDIIAEETIWNNKTIKHSTNDQIDKVIQFYLELLIEHKTPFKVYIDNASLSDLYLMFNQRLELFDLDTSYIEFLPTIKVPIEMRIHVINLMLSTGMLRIDIEKCPNLYASLRNAHWVVIKKIKEGQKKERNHAETHWLNSGVEYILDSAIYEFKNRWNLVFEKMKN